jgi:hypothetical protein
MVHNAALPKRDLDRRLPGARDADENDARRCDVSARIIAQSRAVLPPPDEGVRVEEQLIRQKSVLALKAGEDVGR